MSTLPGSDLAPILESTLLRADVTGSEVEALCREAMQLGFGGVVVPPLWVPRARDTIVRDRVRLVSVAGFPLGASETAIKVREAALAFERGADEIDFVMPVGLVKERAFGRVAEEFSAMAAEARGRGGGQVIKVILECGCLQETEIREACRLAADAGIHFVKTSTGFGPRGATVEDVRIMRAAVGQSVGVKAAGGIRTLTQARALVAAGASRLGTSSAAAILRGGGPSST
jgi:deoxyribose-phosphate aldolase